MRAGAIAAGQRKGRLTALHKVGEDKHHHQIWLWRCDDGNEIEARKDHVLSGRIASCGCLQREKTVERSTTHGHSRRGKWSAEYRAWVGMWTRCTNPNEISWEDYGGRGIRVCERWKNFENFLADLGPRPSPQHSIDRIDPNGNYEPGNVRWATLIEQANNKRTNRFFTIGDKRQTVAQWGQEYSIKPGLLLKRINAGWHPELIRRLLEIHRERAEEARAA